MIALDKATASEAIYYLWGSCSQVQPIIADGKSLIIDDVLASTLPSLRDTP